MYQQCVHSIEPPVRTWSHYRQKGICTALSSEEVWVWRVWYWFMESGSVEIAAKERMLGWLCPSHLFDPPICRLKASISELHPPLENTDGQIWPYSISETDGHMQIWYSCWHQKTNWQVLKPTAHKTTQSPEGLEHLPLDNAFCF